MCVYSNVFKTYGCLIWQNLMDRRIIGSLPFTNIHTNGEEDEEKVKSAMLFSFHTGHMIYFDSIETDPCFSIRMNDVCASPHPSNKRMRVNEKNMCRKYNVNNPIARRAKNHSKTNICSNGNDTQFYIGPASVAKVYIYILDTRTFDDDMMHCIRIRIAV